ncbi:hypothetical protein [Amycolatopsis sp. Poz14]|uniref:hypothetical protein n=1 Tax=Amycolatopsis sp. Poz14 TaxID=1447705 RepID=UPI001EE85378|nr:hypothetical protein [Amycolatopsis sp. Poz14]MCG3752504.1 hypothetical protein [Amycolatopsis sp. Poz14]
MTSEQTRALVRAVEHLAEPAAAQVAYLRTCPSADELALVRTLARDALVRLNRS